MMSQAHLLLGFLIPKKFIFPNPDVLNPHFIHRKVRAVLQDVMKPNVMKVIQELLSQLIIMSSFVLARVRYLFRLTSVWGQVPSHVLISRGFAYRDLVYV